LFFGAQETEGNFNTNSMLIRDPNWHATDRYFLNISKKGNNNFLGGFKVLENLILKSKVKNLSSENIQFFKNSDHSDMNR
jgi:hypothetical protein